MMRAMLVPVMRGVMCNQAMRVIFLFSVFLAGCTDLKIDACLDNGGSFDYVKCECDFKENHESIEPHSCN